MSLFMVFFAEFMKKEFVFATRNYPMSERVANIALHLFQVPFLEFLKSLIINLTSGMSDSFLFKEALEFLIAHTGCPADSVLGECPSV